jgi:23S rRNA (pseudouridine1915-N3)-methyltransferase
VVRGEKGPGVKIVFCFTGKTFLGPLRECVDDYKKRISRYAPVEIIEGKHLRVQPREGRHIVLSPGGKSLSSEEFAHFIEKNLNSGTKNLYFYIGGPDGLDTGIMEKADLNLSFSLMTFNHQIIRVMLLEQVYRAFTIIRGEPYHK